MSAYPLCIFLLGKMIAKTLCVAALVGSASAFVPAVVGRSSALSLRMGSNVSPLGKPISQFCPEELSARLFVHPQGSPHT